jgi:putative DNA methylase
VIAAVGAGLRAFTKYERVEFANGEEVPAERFLAEVEGVVLDVMLEQIAGKVARGVTAVDQRSRFYVLWRYVYKAAAIDAGEAIVFTYGQHVELDGQKGLSGGRNPLVEKQKNTYRLRDFTDRGDDEKLGQADDSGEAAPLIDALHRVLWLMEHRSPRAMTDFFREARVNRDQLRVLAQALSGPALRGGELGEVSAGSELAALTKLTSNWKSVIDDALSPLERSGR